VNTQPSPQSSLQSPLPQSPPSLQQAHSQAPPLPQPTLTKVIDLLRALRLAHFQNKKEIEELKRDKSDLIAVLNQMAIELEEIREWMEETKKLDIDQQNRFALLERQVDEVRVNNRRVGTESLRSFTAVSNIHNGLMPLIKLAPKLAVLAEALSSFASLSSLSGAINEKRHLSEETRKLLDH
jgi:hypothetical protein